VLAKGADVVRPTAVRAAEQTAKLAVGRLNLVSADRTVGPGSATGHRPAPRGERPGNRITGEQFRP